FATPAFTSAACVRLFPFPLGKPSANAVAATVLCCLNIAFTRSGFMSTLNLVLREAFSALAFLDVDAISFAPLWPGSLRGARSLEDEEGYRATVRRYRTPAEYLRLSICRNLSNIPMSSSRSRPAQMLVELIPQIEIGGTHRLRVGDVLGRALADQN